VAVFIVKLFELSLNEDHTFTKTTAAKQEIPSKKEDSPRTSEWTIKKITRNVWRGKQKLIWARWLLKAV